MDKMHLTTYRYTTTHLRGVYGRVWYTEGTAECRTYPTPPHPVFLIRMHAVGKNAELAEKK